MRYEPFNNDSLGENKYMIVPEDDPRKVLEVIAKHAYMTAAIQIPIFEAFRTVDRLPDFSKYISDRDDRLSLSMGLVDGKDCHIWVVSRADNRLVFMGDYFEQRKLSPMMKNKGYDFYPSQLFLDEVVEALR